MAAGGAPYSEGIYEDVNKAIVAGFYWDPDRKAEETVREYVSFEFSPDAVDELTEAAQISKRITGVRRFARVRFVLWSLLKKRKRF